MGIRPHAVLARGVLADRDDGAPLREPGTELAVLRQPLPEAVETLRDLLARSVREVLRAGVDLDAGDDALLGELRRERRPVGRRLADRLVVEDDARDVVGGAVRREQEIAVAAPRLLRRLDADGVEALLDGPARFVGGEDALPRGDECFGGAFQLVRHVANLPPENTF